MIGIGTALADDPILTCRLPGMAKDSPLRVVLDSGLRLPTQSRLAQSAGETPLLIIAGDDASAAPESALRASGVDVARVLQMAAQLDLIAVLKLLATRGITRLMVEGGARMASSLVAAGLVDEIWLLRGPGTVGADGVPALDAMPLSTITQSPTFKVRASETLGEDTLTIYERV